MGKKGHEKHSEEDEGHGKKEREKLDARDGKQKHMKISVRSFRPVYGDRRG